jgi:hypothetical protein
VLAEGMCDEDNIGKFEYSLEYSGADADSRKS